MDRFFGRNSDQRRLHSACESGDLKEIQQLHVCGADMDVTRPKNNGWTPMFIACCYGHFEKNDIQGCIQSYIWYMSGFFLFISGCSTVTTISTSDLMLTSYFLFFFLFLLLLLFFDRIFFQAHHAMVIFRALTPIH